MVVSPIYLAALFLSAPAGVEEKSAPVKEIKSENQNAPSASTRTINWKFGGVAHAVTVRKEAGDLKMLERPHSWLRSAVGPMFATLHRKSWPGDDGTTYQSEKISTDFEGSYHFDLIEWIDRSGQSGKVLRQLIAAPSCSLSDDCGPRNKEWSRRPHCPSADAVDAWDGGFLELATMLVDAKCIDESSIRLQPKSFWIDAWDGEFVRLSVQRGHCDASPIACEGVYSNLTMLPPRVWRGWLENASDGKGFLRSQSESGKGLPLPPG